LVPDELRDYGAPAAVVRRASRFIDVELPVGLFADLPYRAQLYLEVPRVTRSVLRRGLSILRPVVPDVRAWARWVAGRRSGQIIHSHHQYPDMAICACMPDQWMWGVHPLLRYIDFCIVWIGKALHEELHPGTQHFSEKIRVERDRVDEYCGCGKAVRYADCHRAADLELGVVERCRRFHGAQQGYLAELEHQGRTPAPPD
jgi:hypothetical protein